MLKNISEQDSKVLIDLLDSISQIKRSKYEYDQL